MLTGQLLLPFQQTWEDKGKRYVNHLQRLYHCTGQLIREQRDIQLTCLLEMNISLFSNVTVK